jgi:hypothetical protein
MPGLRKSGLISGATLGSTFLVMTVLLGSSMLGPMTARGGWTRGLEPGLRPWAELDSAPVPAVSAWKNISLSAGYPPTACARGSMTYDQKDGYVVLFEGSCWWSPLSSSTWRFVGGIWSLVSTKTAPSPRVDAAVVYDSRAGAVLLFGGYGSPTPYSGGHNLNDTWEFSGGIWKNLSISRAPPPRTYTSLAYDSKDGYAVLFGGGNWSSGGLSPGTYNDTWEFAGGRWVQIHTTVHPPPLILESFTYDPDVGALIQYGGFGVKGGSTAAFHETWEFAGGSWTQLSLRVHPPPLAYAVSAYDPTFRALILNDRPYRGSPTWEFQAGHWTTFNTTASPSKRFGALEAYDQKDGYLVLFGGYGNTGSDTWKLT